MTAKKKSAKKNTPKKVLLINVCSLKGGVGKSTLALLCGANLAANGVRTWLFDLDLTGTNLALGLDNHGLTAGKNGKKYLHEYLSLPPIGSEDGKKTAEDIQWRFNGVKDLSNLTILPSAVDEKSRQALEPLITTEHWTQYLRTQLMNLVSIYLNPPKNKPERAAIIFDHAPGAHELCLEFINAREPVTEFLKPYLPGWEINLKHVLVTSGDTADLAAAGTFFNDYISESEATRKEEASREFNVVLNRYVSKFDPSGDTYRKKVQEFFDEIIPGALNLDLIRYDEKFYFFHAVETKDIAKTDSLPLLGERSLPSLWKDLRSGGWIK